MTMRVLVIEDDSASLELMGYLLRAFGYDTMEVADGVAGIEAARRERPDLVLCDIQLPGLSGLEVAARLKSDPHLRSIPLVAVTAFAMVGDEDRILGAGFDGYIAKPIYPETFVARVEAFLPGRRSRGEASDG